jgi:hypothetical protein
MNNGIVSDGDERVVSSAETVADQGQVVLKNYALDLMMISRNVRDLAKTAGFAHMAELEELHNLAYTNLKSKMKPGQPLAEDPALVIDTFKMISSVMLQVVETKRKAADTLLKARVLIDVSPPGEGGGFEQESDPFEGEPLGAEIHETGVFGPLAEIVGEGEEEEPDTAV